MQDVRIHKLLSAWARGPSGSGAIVVEDLAKRYADGTEAVRGISFEVRSGEVFSVVEPSCGRCWLPAARSTSTSALA